jgi:regulator of cell morphogenesis and NO signaling
MINKNSILKDLASDKRHLEPVIERLGLEKQWDGSIEEACINNSANPDFVIQILNTFDEQGYFPKEELWNFPLGYILKYLRKTHDYYLNKRLPEIEQSLHFFKEQFAGDNAIHLILAKLFSDYKKDLSEHIQNEEEILFPYIDELLKGNIPLNMRAYSIETIISEHEDVEEALEQIRNIIVKYSKTAEDILPFRIFLHQLNVFENDLCKHALVEGQILLPQAFELEKKIKMDKSQV